jgi:hypothetical protein
MLRRLLPSLVLASSALASFASAPATRAAEPAPPTDPTERAEWLSGQAEIAFQEKRFADAIRLYLDAWEVVPAASILYNVAFIYDKRLDDPELAIDYYDRAATSSDADDELKAKARARIAALRLELKKPPDKPDRPDKPVEPPDDEGSVVGPWIVTAAGGAVLVGGVAMGLIASGTEGDFHSARSADEKRDLQSQGRTEALVADVLMGVGVAAVGVGVVWLILDAGSEPGEGRVSPVGDAGWRVEPRLVPGGAALVLGGTL